jgi:hypothetical protein
MGEKLDRLVQEGVIDPDHADQLQPAVVAKIEATSMADIEAVIAFFLDISPGRALEPEADGAFL